MHSFRSFSIQKYKSFVRDLASRLELPRPTQFSRVGTPCCDHVFRYSLCHLQPRRCKALPAMQVCSLLFNDLSGDGMVSSQVTLQERSNHVCASFGQPSPLLRLTPWIYPLNPIGRILVLIFCRRGYGGRSLPKPPNSKIFLII